MKHEKNPLTDVIEYSEVMLREAELGNWKNVYSIEEQRSELLKEIFAKPLLDDAKENYSEEIMKVLFLNKKLETITEVARENIRSELGSMSKGRQAVNVYAENAR